MNEKISKNRFQIAKRATLVNAITNTLLAVAKVVIGILGHSSALIADGIHSLSDLVTDALVLVASGLGTKHPDIGHPYGHRRIETLAAITISLLFLGTGLFIIYDAYAHFLHKTMLVKPSLAVIITAIFSTAANEWLFRYTLRKGTAIQSRLLIANAWHNRSDAYVSLIVLVSVSCTWLGLHYFDLIGAAVIALFIVKRGVKILWESTNELLDAAVDKSTLHNIQKTIQEVSGVHAIHQLRTRQHSGSILVDVHIQVPPTISVSEGHFISERVRLHLLNTMKNILDVTVHIDSEDDETCNPSVHLDSRPILHKRLKQRWATLPGYDAIQNMQLHYLNGKLHLELLMPLSLLQSISAEKLTAQYQQSIQDCHDIASIRIDFTQS